MPSCIAGGLQSCRALKSLSKGVFITITVRPIFLFKILISFHNTVMDTDRVVQRLRGIIVTAVRPTIKTTLWLLKIMLPITLIVKVLQYLGVIEWLAQYLNTVFVYMGLPGASAIAWLTGASVSTYAGIAVMLSMPMTLRQATIIAIMTCLCHSLPMEGAVVSKTGSNFMRMTVIRIIAAFVSGVYLNVVLPDMDTALAITLTQELMPASITAVVGEWIVSSAKMSVFLVMLIYALMLIQRLLDDFGLMYLLVKPLRPFMKLFGLPEHASYLWLVGNVLGISYGSAMMMELIDSGKVSKEEADTVNYHLIMNHSMLEDTLVYAAVGISAFWILSTRILYATILVWMVHAIRRIAKS